MTVAFSGKVWVFGDNLNTDAMYPAFAMKMDPPEAAKHIFYEVRPGWTDLVSPGDVVLAGAPQPQLGFFRVPKIIAEAE